MANHVAVVDYFNRRGVSAIFLFRRNLLRQLVSQLANNHDRFLKQLNGTHKAHVHTEHEVMLFIKRWFNSLPGGYVMSGCLQSLELVCMVDVLLFFFAPLFAGPYTREIQAQAQHVVANTATETG